MLTSQVEDDNIPVIEALSTGLAVRQLSRRAASTLVASVTRHARKTDALTCGTFTLRGRWPLGITVTSCRAGNEEINISIKTNIFAIIILPKFHDFVFDHPAKAPWQTVYRTPAGTLRSGQKSMFYFRGLLFTSHWLNLQHWAGFYIAVYGNFQGLFFDFQGLFLAFRGWNHPEPRVFFPGCIQALGKMPPLITFANIQSCSSKFWANSVFNNLVKMKKYWPWQFIKIAKCCKWVFLWIYCPGRCVVKIAHHKGQKCSMVVGILRQTICQGA